jgi:hypothetical protein
MITAGHAGASPRAPHVYRTWSASPTLGAGQYPQNWSGGQCRGRHPGFGPLYMTCGWIGITRAWGGAAAGRNIDVRNIGAAEAADAEDPKATTARSVLKRLMSDMNRLLCWTNVDCSTQLVVPTLLQVQSNRPRLMGSPIPIAIFLRINLQTLICCTTCIKGLH